MSTTQVVFESSEKVKVNVHVDPFPAYDTNGSYIYNSYMSMAGL